MTALHQQLAGLASGCQRPLNDLGAFGNKHSLFRLKPVEQLRLGQPGEYIQLRVLKIRNFNKISHAFSPIAMSRMTSPARISPAAPGTKLTEPGICRLPNAAASSSQPVGLSASSWE